MRTTLTVALLSAAAAAASANADTLHMAFQGTGSGTTVRVQSDVYSGRVFAGELFHSFSGAPASTADLLEGKTLATFCIDLAQSVGAGGFVEYMISDATQAGPTGLSTQAADALLGVFSAAAQSLADLRAAGTATTQQEKDAAAAVQLALWEVAQDFDATRGAGLDLASGNFKAFNADGSALRASIADQAARLISTGLSLTRAQRNDAIVFVSGSRQDQILALPGSGTNLPVVPAPTAAAMGLLGLGAVANRRRRA